MLICAIEMLNIIIITDYNRISLAYNVSYSASRDVIIIIIIVIIIAIITIKKYPFKFTPLIQHH